VVTSTLEGDVFAGFTVSVAELLVTLPRELLTIASNVEPVSPETVGGVE
jgi:hypothetical protein